MPAERYCCERCGIFFSSWGSACVSPPRLNSNCSISQLLVCDVRRGVAGIVVCTFVHMCLFLVRFRVCSHHCVWLCACCVSDLQVFTDKMLFSPTPPLFVVVVVTMAPAYFGPADHLLRIAKLLPPCHYGDTGCYTSANQCGVEDVKKLPGFLFITWKVNPCFCVSLFISVVCVSCNITVGKNRRLEWKDKPQQTILSIVKNKTCHMPHTSPTVYEKKVP